jgi:hypothetical protein
MHNTVPRYFISQYHVEHCYMFRSLMGLSSGNYIKVTFHKTEFGLSVVIWLSTMHGMSNIRKVNVCEMCCFSDERSCVVNSHICIGRLCYSGVCILNVGRAALRRDFCINIGRAAWQVYRAVRNLGTDSVITMEGKYEKLRSLDNVFHQLNALVIKTLKYSKTVW